MGRELLPIGDLPKIVSKLQEIGRGNVEITTAHRKRVWYLQHCGRLHAVGQKVSDLTNAAIGQRVQSCTMNCHATARNRLAIFPKLFQNCKRLDGEMLKLRQRIGSAYGICNIAVDCMP
jgi:hypothetical protein